MQDGAIKTDRDICRIIEQDMWMMEILRDVRWLGLPDSWVCAGFVRAKVGMSCMATNIGLCRPMWMLSTTTNEDVREETEKVLESKRRQMSPSVPWSVKNQARMHIVDDAPPYCSSFDAIANFPETATALAVRLTEADTVELMAPWGVDDLSIQSVAGLWRIPIGVCFLDTKIYKKSA